MRRDTVAERYHRRVDHSDPKAAKDYRAIKCLISGGSIAQASVASGWSQRSLYQRGIIQRYRDYLLSHETSNHRAEPDRGGVIDFQGIQSSRVSKAIPPVAPASPNRAHEA